MQASAVNATAGPTASSAPGIISWFFSHLSGLLTLYSTQEEIDQLPGFFGAFYLVVVEFFSTLGSFGGFLALVYKAFLVRNGWITVPLIVIVFCLLLVTRNINYFWKHDKIFRRCTLMFFQSFVNVNEYWANVFRIFERLMFSGTQSYSQSIVTCSGLFVMNCLFIVGIVICFVLFMLRRFFCFLCCVTIQDEIETRPLGEVLKGPCKKTGLCDSSKLEPINPNAAPRARQSGGASHADSRQSGGDAPVSQPQTSSSRFSSWSTLFSDTRKPVCDPEVTEKWRHELTKNEYALLERLKENELTDIMENFSFPHSERLFFKQRYAIVQRELKEVEEKLAQRARDAECARSQRDVQRASQHRGAETGDDENLNRKTPLRTAVDVLPPASAESSPNPRSYRSTKDVAETPSGRGSIGSGRQRKPTNQLTYLQRFELIDELGGRAPGADVCPMDVAGGGV